MEKTRILTMQDISCVGRCSITVALPIISACGVEASILPSAVLSTHVGFEGPFCRDLTYDIEDIYKHWLKEKVEFSALYTGYLANKKQIEYVIDIMNSGLICNGSSIVVLLWQITASFTAVLIWSMSKRCTGFVNMRISYFPILPRLH